MFRNNNKKTDKHPDERGTLMVNGVEFEISSWTKQSKAGEYYRSLSVREKRSDYTPQNNPEPIRYGDNMEDHINF